MSGRWVDLREAAELMGTSTEAVRKRAARGSLRSDRHDGRVVVWVDEGRTEGRHQPQVDHESLIEAKDETIRILEEQLRLRAEEIQRRDVIISQLTQANAALAARVPELEASVTPSSQSQEPQGGPPNAGAGLSREEPRPATTEGPQEAAEPRSWWRRVLGG